MSAWPPFLALPDRPNTSEVSALAEWYRMARPLLYQYEALVFDALRARGFAVTVVYDLAAENPYYPIGWAVSGRVEKNGVSSGFLMQELTPLYFTPAEFAARAEFAWQAEASAPALVIQAQTPAPAPYNPSQPAVIPQTAPANAPQAVARTAQEERLLRRGRAVPRVPAMAVSDALEVLFR